MAKKSARTLGNEFDQQTIRYFQNMKMFLILTWFNIGLISISKSKINQEKILLDLACELKLLYKGKYEAVEFHWRAKLNKFYSVCKTSNVVPSREKQRG